MTNQLNLVRVAPVLLTISAFICGIYSIKLSISGHFSGAIIFMIIAAIFDLFDGRVARILRAESAFGAELDSLSDLVCFGIASSIAIILFQNPDSKIIFLSSCFFATASLLRLARFNVTEVQKEKGKVSNHFTGVPAPAGAILSLLPINLYNSFGIEFSDITVSIYTVFVALTMIGTFNTPSPKGIYLSRSSLIILIMIFMFIVVNLLMHIWILLSVLSIIYLFVILVCIAIHSRNYIKSQKSN